MTSRLHYQLADAPPPPKPPPPPLEPSESELELLDSNQSNEPLLELLSRSAVTTTLPGSFGNRLSSGTAVAVTGTGLTWTAGCGERNGTPSVGAGPDGATHPP